MPNVDALVYKYIESKKDRLHAALTLKPELLQLPHAAGIIVNLLNITEQLAFYGTLSQEEQNALMKSNPLPPEGIENITKIPTDEEIRRLLEKVTKNG